MKKPYLQAVIRAAEQSDGRTRFEAVASTDAVDRDGEVIEVSGWEWKEPFPPLLWGHDGREITHVLGRIEDIKRTDAALVVTASVNDAASDAHRAAGILLRSGDLNKLSVGFSPLSWTEPDGTTVSRGNGDAFPIPRKGRRYTRQELLELSLVAVPSNPQALVAGFKGLGLLCEEEKQEEEFTEKEFWFSKFGIAPVEKVGAVLNKQNMSKLEEIQRLAGEVLDSAKRAEEVTQTTNREG